MINLYGMEMKKLQDLMVAEDKNLIALFSYTLGYMKRTLVHLMK